MPDRWLEKAQGTNNRLGEISYRGSCPSGRIVTII